MQGEPYDGYASTRRDEGTRAGSASARRGDSSSAPRASLAGETWQVEAMDSAVGWSGALVPVVTDPDLHFINLLIIIIDIGSNCVMNEAQTGQEAKEERWVDRLDEEDLAFLKRFLLASGSLKETAEAYGISYPTVRLRLDRLIEKIKVWDSQEPMSAFERTLRALCADDKLDLATLRVILAAHREQTRRT